MSENSKVERPILMSGAMVRASMREVDPKTHTRRVMKPQPEHKPGAPGRTVDDPNSAVKGQKVWKASDWWIWRNSKLDAGYCHTNREAMERLMLDCCPYGKPGDRLWVRETFSLNHSTHYSHDNGRVSGMIYRASWDGDVDFYKRPFEGERRWRPSIHMPRWASRLTLEIVKVRVERVQDISEADAIAEGVSLSFSDMYWQGGTSWTDNRNPAFDPKRAITGPRAAFGMLWDSINSKRDGGKFAWNKNPWVWVIEFKRTGCSERIHASDAASG